MDILIVRKRGAPRLASSNRPAAGFAGTEPSIVYFIGNFILATAKILDMALVIYLWIVIARALLSWVNPDPYNPIVQFLHRVTDPVMERVRQFLPMSGIGIDFSPIVIIFAIYFLQMFLIRSLQQFALQLQ